MNNFGDFRSPINNYTNILGNQRPYDTPNHRQLFDDQALGRKPSNRLDDPSLSRRLTGNLDDQPIRRPTENYSQGISPNLLPQQSNLNSNDYLKQPTNDFYNRPTPDYNTQTSAPLLPNRGSKARTNQVYDKNKNSFQFMATENEIKCIYHKEFRENFVEEECYVDHTFEVNGFSTTKRTEVPLNGRICKQCLSISKGKFSNQKVSAKYYTEIITEKKGLLTKFRNASLGFDLSKLRQPSQVTQIIDLFPNVDTFIEEIIDACNEFDDDVISKFGGLNISQEDLNKLTNFIQQIKLNSLHEPDVNGIGENQTQKIEYLQLAKFLVYFQEDMLSDVKSSFSGSSSRLQQFVRKLIDTRKKSVNVLTNIIRIATGDFYRLCFNTENLPVDEAFLRTIQIEFGSDEDALKLKKYFENLISNKDGEINHWRSEADKFIRLHNQAILEIEDLKRRLGSVESDASINLRIQNIRNEFIHEMNEKEHYIQKLEQQLNQLKHQINSMEQHFRK